MEPIAVRTFLTLAVAAVTAAMLALNTRLKRGDARQCLLVALALVGMFWLPRSLRDFLISFSAAAIVIKATEGQFFRTRGVWGLACFGFVYLVSLMAPGGGASPLLMLAAAAAAPLTYRGARELQRLARAHRLKPGEPSDGIVDVGGLMSPDTVAPPEGYRGELSAAAWQIEWLDGDLTGRPETLSMQTEHGTVLVDLGRTRLSVDEDHTVSLRIDAARPIARNYGKVPALERAPGTDAPTFYATLRYLVPDTQAYVLGTPIWERSAGGTYRDGVLVPRFSGELHGQPAAEVKRRAQWNLARAASFGALATAIGLALMYGMT